MARHRQQRGPVGLDLERCRVGIGKGGLQRLHLGEQSFGSVKLAKGQRIAHDAYPRQQFLRDAAGLASKVCRAHKGVSRQLHIAQQNAGHHSQIVVGPERDLKQVGVLGQFHRLAQRG